MDVRDIDSCDPVMVRIDFGQGYKWGYSQFFEGDIENSAENFWTFDFYTPSIPPLTKPRSDHSLLVITIVKHNLFIHNIHSILT